MPRRVMNVLTLLSLLLLAAVVLRWRWDWAAGKVERGSAWRASVTVFRPAARPGDRVVLVLEDFLGPGLVTRRTVRVADDGTIRLPRAGRLHVGGIDGTEIARAAQEAYRRPILVHSQWVQATVGGGDWRVPYALLAALAALLPGARLCTAIARALRRPAAGHCAACGYDLRASPARCPECGAPSMG